MGDHPDWNFDSSGNAVVPAEAPVEHTALVKAIESSDGPATSTQVVPAAPAKKNISGLPDWNKPRDEAGRYVSKDKAEYLAQWAKEGGIAANVAAVNRVESVILNASSDATALQAHVATLDEDIRLLAADHMRLTTAHGPNGGSIKLDGFLNALSPSQFETFHRWWRGLSRGDQDAILGSISL